MGKIVNNYPEQRIKEFPNDGLIVGADDKLYCGLCNKDIDASKASKVRDHVKSKKHEANRIASKSTPSIAVAFRPKDTWRNLVDVFLDAGIPLKIFRNERFRQWTKTNVKDGHTLPSETSIRKLVNLSAHDDEEATKSLLQDKDVIVIADESTDLKNRKVLNILLSSAEPNSKFRLVATKFLDEVNSAVVSSSIIDAIKNMGVPYDRVVCICSDNAPYMIAAGRTLSGVFSSNKITKEGEVISCHQEDLKLNGSEPKAGKSILLWPTVISHTIDNSSALYHIHPSDLTAANQSFEIIVVMEGVVESTGLLVQARTSYLPGEILWGQRFQDLASNKASNGERLIDFSKFHETYAVVSSRLSASEMCVVSS